MPLLIGCHENYGTPFLNGPQEFQTTNQKLSKLRLEALKLYFSQLVAVELQSGERLRTRQVLEFKA